MTLVVKYPTRKAAREAIGKPLRYIETSMFGDEYKRDGVLTVVNRPQLTRLGHEWYGQITMKDGKIVKVD